MDIADTVIAVFSDHEAAEAAVAKLTAAGFDTKNLSVVGKGYHSDETAVGFHSLGERITFWGKRGAFWGGLWGMFFGGLFLTFPGVGPVLVLGYIGATVLSAVESAVTTGGFGPLGEALSLIGVPEHRASHYEAAVNADGFLVMAHGSADDMARAKAILAAGNPSSLDVHSGTPIARAQ